MNKKVLLISSVGVIFFVLIIFSFFNKKHSEINKIKNDASTAVIEKTILEVNANIRGVDVEIDTDGEGLLKYPLSKTPARIVNIPEGPHRIYAFKEGYDEQFIDINIKSGTQSLMINMEKAISVTLEPFADDVSAYYSPQHLDDIYYSPDKKNQFSIQANLLKIVDQNNDTHEISLEEGFDQETATWMDNNTILIIEKQSKLPYLDKLYLVSIYSFQKKLIINSSDIIGRIDFSFPLQVSNDGRSVLMKENDNGFWILKFE